MSVEFKLAGLDYRSATVAVRERFSFTESGRRELLRSIAPYVEEAVLISTCNRTELVALCEDDPADPHCVQLLVGDHISVRVFFFREKWIHGIISFSSPDAPEASSAPA